MASYILSFQFCSAVCQIMAGRVGAAIWIDGITLLLQKWTHVNFKISMKETCLLHFSWKEMKQERKEEWHALKVPGRMKLGDNSVHGQRLNPYVMSTPVSTGLLIINQSDHSCGQQSVKETAYICVLTCERSEGWMLLLQLWLGFVLVYIYFPHNAGTLFVHVLDIWGRTNSRYSTQVSV